MDDKEQAAIDALRAAGLDAEADAVQSLRALHRATMDAYHADQRASYADGQAAERERCAKLCEEARDAVWPYHAPEVLNAACTVCENLANRIRGVGA